MRLTKLLPYFDFCKSDQNIKTIKEIFDKKACNAEITTTSYPRNIIFTTKKIITVMYNKPNHCPDKMLLLQPDISWIYVIPYSCGEKTGIFDQIS